MLRELQLLVIAQLAVMRPFSLLGPSPSSPPPSILLYFSVCAARARYGYRPNQLALGSSVSAGLVSLWLRQHGHRKRQRTKTERETTKKNEGAAVHLREKKMEGRADVFVCVFHVE